jgi:lysophospholipase L1-like esterase
MAFPAPRSTILLAATFALAACAAPAPGDEGESESQVAAQRRPNEGSSPAPSEPSLPGSQATRTVRSLANLGDSISQGFDADDSEPIDLSVLARAPERVFQDATAFSWVQGTDPRVRSIASRYKAAVPALEVTAMSRTGAELVNIHDGVPNFEQQASDLEAKGASPDLVYVLLGGNDVCHRPRSTTADPTSTLYPVDTFRRAAEAGLAVLAKRLPKGATVRVASMPRVDRLYESAAALEVPMRDVVGGVEVHGTLSCTGLWSAAARVDQAICPAVTLEPSASRRAAIGARIDAYNDAVAASVRAFDADATRNPNGVHFESDWHGPVGGGGAANASIGTLTFEARHISRRDCFHPSIEGQQLIAETVAERARWTR